MKPMWEQEGIVEELCLLEQNFRPPYPHSGFISRGEENKEGDYNAVFGVFSYSLTP